MKRLINYIKSINDLCYLTIIYTLSQIMLLFVSGRWWDDWCGYNQPLWVLKDAAYQIGRPDSFYISQFVQALPESGYRIITFFLFYFCMVFFYKLLKNWLNDNTSFWICALYAVIPANDARIMVCVFHYSIGIFFFMAGLYCLTEALKLTSVSIIKRIFILLLFLFSFILNSNLFFYLISLLVILVKEKSIKAFYLKYLDFLLLPILYFVIKTKCFPAHGVYDGYNSVNSLGFFVAFKYILQADAFVIFQLFINWLEAGSKWARLLPFVFFFWLFVNKGKEIPLITKSFLSKGIFIKRSWHTEQDAKNLNEDISILLAGLLILSIGLFPYIVVRHSYVIGTTGADGRDAILATFGAAMVIYSLIDLVFKKGIVKYIYSMLIICGILFFNKYYISYQHDYYSMLGFQYQLSQHQELKDFSNIAYVNTDSRPIKLHDLLYVLNANAEEIYKNQKRLICDVKGITALMKDDKMRKVLVNNRIYHMSEYDTTNTDIEALVDYSFDCRTNNIIGMRFYEIANQKKFKDKIKEYSNMKILSLNSAHNDMLLNDASIDALNEIKETVSYIEKLLEKNSHKTISIITGSPFSH